MTVRYWQRADTLSAHPGPLLAALYCPSRGHGHAEAPAATWLVEPSYSSTSSFPSFARRPRPLSAHDVSGAGRGTSPPPGPRVNGRQPEGGPPPTAQEVQVREAEGHSEATCPEVAEGGQKPWSVGPQAARRLELGLRCSSLGKDPRTPGAGLLPASAPAGVRDGTAACPPGSELPTAFGLGGNAHFSFTETPTIRNDSGDQYATYRGETVSLIRLSIKGAP